MQDYAGAQTLPRHTGDGIDILDFVLIKRARTACTIASLQTRAERTLNPIISGQKALRTQKRAVKMHKAFDEQQQSLPPPDPRVVLRQAVRTWKNIGLLLLLVIALISLVAGLNCDAATDDAGACATLLSAFTARQLTYAGAALTFGFCCCPCFRLDCDADELRKRSCFLQAVERRRRERARQARLGRGDDGGAAAPDVEEGHELINRRPGGGG